MPRISGLVPAFFLVGGVTIDSSAGAKQFSSMGARSTFAAPSAGADWDGGRGKGVLKWHEKGAKNGQGCNNNTTSNWAGNEKTGGGKDTDTRCSDGRYMVCPIGPQTCFAWAVIENGCARKCPNGWEHLCE